MFPQTTFSQQNFSTDNIFLAKCFNRQHFLSKMFPLTTFPQRNVSTDNSSLAKCSTDNISSAKCFHRHYFLSNNFTEVNNLTQTVSKIFIPTKIKKVIVTIFKFCRTFSCHKMFLFRQMLLQNIVICNMLQP